MTNQSDSPDGVNWEHVARVETHLIRLSILDLLAIDGGRTLSPMEMSRELQEPLGKIVYHAAELCKSRLIRLVHEHEVGGTIEHFYCLPGHSPVDLFERLKQWNRSLLALRAWS